MIDIVVKLGGGVLAQQTDFERVLETISAAASKTKLLIVPGGGPFADAVRHVYQDMLLSEEAAHWMAVLAMDQYAHLVASRLVRGRVATTPASVSAILESGDVPVLAPSRWLQDVDPLPHSWDVTSDSIAAWIAGALGAHHLVLVKPSNASGIELVDVYFAHALPPKVEHSIVPADQIHALASALRPKGTPA